MYVFWVLAFFAAILLLSWFLRRPLPSVPGDRQSLTPEQKMLYDVALEPGKDGKPVLYALQDCRHCRRTRDFLEKHGVSFHLVMIDVFPRTERSRLMKIVRSYNPRGSFPTTVLPDGRVIVGYREEVLASLT